MGKRAIKKVAVKIDDQEPQILNRVILNPKRSWFRDNRWWLAPVGAVIVPVVTWLIAYGANRQKDIDDNKYRDDKLNILFHWHTGDSLMLMRHDDSLDQHKDNFNNLKAGCYKQ